MLGKITKVVLPQTRIDDIGCDHGVKMNAPEVDTVKRQDLSIVFDILTYLFHLFIFQDTSQDLKGLGAVQLSGGAQIGVGDGQIECLSLFAAKGDPHQVGLKRVLAGGLGIQRYHPHFFYPAYQGQQLFS